LLRRAWPGAFAALFPSWSRIGIVSVHDDATQDEHAMLIEAIERQVEAGSIVSVRVEKGAVSVERLIEKFSQSLADDGLGVHILLGEGYMLAAISEAIDRLGMIGVGWTWIGSERLLGSSGSEILTGISRIPEVTKNMVLLRLPSPAGELFEEFRGSSGQVFESMRSAFPIADMEPLLSAIFTSVSLLTAAAQRGIDEGAIKYSTTDAGISEEITRQVTLMDSPERGAATLQEGSPFHVHEGNRDVGWAYFDVLQVVDHNEAIVGQFKEGNGIRLFKNITWHGGSTAIPSDVAPARLVVTPASSSGATTSIALAAGVSVFVLVAAIVVLVWVRRMSGKHEAGKDLSGQVAGVGGTRAPQELDRAWITLIQELGSGMFGEVFKATIKHAGVPPYTVAVKTLKSGTPEEDENEFLREACVMAQFDHQNVISLVGVVTSSMPMFVVLQYAEHGSLLEFVKQRKGFLELSLISKIYLARDIVQGMLHIGANRIVHRDLAARNVLLDSNYHCKVADFGHARVLDENGKFTCTNSKLAVRWTAPESLSRKEFSLASDVWSFGVVLYEIFTSGETPYGGMNNMEVWLSIQSGMRLKRPPSCPDEIYVDIMRSCWKESPSERKTFQDISDYLEKMLKTEEEIADGDLLVAEEQEQELDAEGGAERDSQTSRGTTPNRHVSMNSMRSSSQQDDIMVHRQNAMSSTKNRSSMQQRVKIRGGSSSEDPYRMRRGSFASSMRKESNNAPTPDIEDGGQSRSNSISGSQRGSRAASTSVYADFGDMSRFEDSSVMPPPLWRGSQTPLMIAEEGDEQVTEKSAPVPERRGSGRLRRTSLGRPGERRFSRKVSVYEDAARDAFEPLLEEEHEHEEEGEGIELEKPTSDIATKLASAPASSGEELGADVPHDVNTNATSMDTRTRSPPKHERMRARSLDSKEVLDLAPNVAIKGVLKHSHGLLTSEEDAMVVQEEEEEEEEKELRAVMQKRRSSNGDGGAGKHIKSSGPAMRPITPGQQSAELVSQRLSVSASRESPKLRPMSPLGGGIISGRASVEVRSLRSARPSTDSRGIRSIRASIENFDTQSIPESVLNSAEESEDERFRAGSPSPRKAHKGGRRKVGDDLARFVLTKKGSQSALPKPRVDVIEACMTLDGSDVPEHAPVHHPRVEGLEVKALHHGGAAYLLPSVGKGLVTTKTSRGESPRFLIHDAVVVDLSGEESSFV
jgi:serine/threonine protein kinase